MRLASNAGEGEGGGVMGDERDMAGEVRDRVIGGTGGSGPWGGVMRPYTVGTSPLVVARLRCGEGGQETSRDVLALERTPSSLERSTCSLPLREGRRKTVALAARSVGCVWDRGNVLRPLGMVLDLGARRGLGLRGGDGERERWFEDEEEHSDWSGE